MRYVGWIALVLWLALLGAGCGGNSLYIPGVRVPGHTVRTYSGFTVPSFSADGSISMINGGKLLRYSAAGARLSAATLPAAMLGVDGKLVFTATTVPLSGGETLVHGYREKLGRLSPDGQLRWELELPHMMDACWAYADGALVQQMIGTGSALSYVDGAGELKWTKLLGWSSLHTLQVDGQDLIFNILADELRVLNPAGTELKHMPLPAGWYLNSTGPDRILFGTPTGVACWDANCREQWFYAAPPQRWVGAPFMLSPECYALLISRNFYDDIDNLDGEASHGNQLSLLILDGTGQLAAASVEYDVIIPVQACGGNLLAETWRNGQHAWTMFGPDAAPLWSFPIQEEALPEIEEGATVIRHDDTSRATVSPDGRIFVDNLSVLYALDAQGGVLWQAPGEFYSERVVEPYTSYD